MNQSPPHPDPAAPQSRWEGGRLALLDLWHDRRTTLVLVLTVAAIIAPLMLLLGLKTGVIATLRQDLLNDPRTREIIIYGAHHLDRAWFQTMARRPDVGFLLPRTRTINATIDLLDGAQRPAEAIDLIPTAAGDPLLPPGLPAPVSADQVLLTQTLARRLGLSPGTPLSGVLSRSRNDTPENAQFPLEIIGIIPEDRVAREAVFTHMDLLVAAEDYRDGLRPTLADLRAPNADTRPEFAGARLYARDLEGVDTLAATLRLQGIEIRTQAERIATVRAFDRTLSFILRIIALIGLTGGALALGGALWVNVERKRRDLALLRLFGFRHGTVVLIPLVQSAVIAALAFLLAGLAYGGGAGAFNRSLGQNLAGQGYVCRLESAHLAAAATATLLVALIAAAAAGYRASRIDPAECLRGG
ncbi:FtsX-like permease family protein [uncultured Thiodictyon sp.]|uniref:FtsX-like permease family protein n=1 Tax=uncultured Thiodictyon sp. TaxID=1846217 RepID=UPI0025FBC963|nr:FtsX-like permease family protein [uncultured Thiodictyon sp.]